MPAHIYMRIGQYHETVLANQNAIKIDEIYIKEHALRGSDYEGFYTHNLLFLIAAATLEGNSEIALENSKKLIDFITDKTFIKLPMMSEVDYDSILATPLFILSRFGQWDKILNQPMPSQNNYYTLTIWHYVRGLAYTFQGRLEEAKVESVKLKQSIQSFGYKKDIGQMVKTLVKIAEKILDGRIAGKEGKENKMLGFYKEALNIEQSLPYSEPPLWGGFPVRQILGFAYLGLKQYKNAEHMFQDDLKQYPSNGWSLYGLSQSLKFQGNSAKSDEVKKEFIEAWKWADIPIEKILLN